MKTFRFLTILVAALLALGEVARWWGDPRIMPLAFDELVVAAAMVAAVLLQRRLGPAPLAAAWAAYCGLVAGLLIPTLDHLMHGPPKESAAFYAVILGVMLALGLGAVWWILARLPGSPRER